MGTDQEWEKWGRQDPYYGVFTSDRFRSPALTPEARAEFFASGEKHVADVLDTCRRLFGSTFSPRRVLDFGCGVGRLVIPFSRVSERVVGVDVSVAMLEEAMRNCEQRGITNAEFALSDDALSTVAGQFDLVHSAITLQHVEVERGRALFSRLLETLGRGGVAAIHLTYAKTYHSRTFGQPPSPSRAASLQRMAGAFARLLHRRHRRDQHLASSDPEMLMIPYPLSDIAFLMQTAGVRWFHAEFTDHGGELGVFLYFRTSIAAAEVAE